MATVWKTDPRPVPPYGLRRYIWPDPHGHEIGPAPDPTLTGGAWPEATFRQEAPGLPWIQIDGPRFDETPAPSPHHPNQLPRPLQADPMTPRSAMGLGRAIGAQ
jgi:hypothetical protein